MAIIKELTMTPRQIERRDTILQTVRTQLEKDGYGALSMRKIAATAGVSPSTLYEIYGGKESLIMHAVGGSISNLSVAEEQYEPGLERFLHRLDALASFFVNNPETGEAITKLLFQNSGDSPAKELFLVNAVQARKVSLEEMLENKELDKDTDIDLYARTLISATWGTVLFWLNDMLPTRDFHSELTKASMAIVLPVATRKSKSRIQDILNASSA